MSCSLIIIIGYVSVLLLLIFVLLFRKISNKAGYIWMRRIVILLIDVLMVVCNISNMEYAENDTG